MSLGAQGGRERAVAVRTDSRRRSDVTALSGDERVTAEGLVVVWSRDGTRACSPTGLMRDTVEMEMTVARWGQISHSFH